MTAGIGVTVVIVVAGAAAQIIDYTVYDLRVRALDSSGDGGIFGAVGDVSLAGAAVAACVLLAHVRPRRAEAAALPALLVFLAVDKVLRIHDHVPHWLALYMPVLAATFVALVGVALDLPARSRRLIGTGLAMVTASFLVHLSGDPVLRHLGAEPGGWPYQIKAVVKHGAEVAGWLAVALGLVAGARDQPLVPRAAARSYLTRLR